MRAPALTLTALLLAYALTTTAYAQTATPERKTAGNRVTENIPEIPQELIDKLNRYQNTRGAGVLGWTKDDCLLISTRFAETAQVHRVCSPMGAREQITFYSEQVAGVTVPPAASSLDGFAFGRDKGGDEFSQLYWYDNNTRDASLLTDGKRSQNGGATFSADGHLMAFTSTARNGTDRDVWVRDMRTGQNTLALSEGGSWSTQDFSRDGKQLIVSRYVAADESYPGVVNLETGKLDMLPIDGGKASFRGLKYSPDGKGIYFVSDEPINGKPSEFLTLRYHALSNNKITHLSNHIPWDVNGFSISEDGKHLGYVTNEDGISKLHLLTLPDHKEVKLPDLPIGLIGGVEFSADGKRLAVTLNTATSPSDVYVIDLPSRKLQRWTKSEVGGLDTAQFSSPTLIHFPTFDRADGKQRLIPAFYYQPKKKTAHGKTPVIITIHGGPEAQSLPSFSPSTQFMLNELGVAVLVPNVRGSTGYGKTYQRLDNAEKREDSVKDIGALLDWIKTQPELDSSRIGVVGGSYGGYMVLSSLMHYSDRIKAGIDIVGISDFTTFLNNTESYRRDLRRAEYGDERDPKMKAIFDQISPLKNASKIKTPLFVAQGKNDPRVPYTEAEQIAKAVRENGQPVWFLMFDNEGHGFRKKTNSDYYNAAEVLFWQQYLLK